MYRYLAVLFAKKGITPENAAVLLGMSEGRFLGLLYEGSFSVREAFLIRNRFFPEYDIAALFRKNTHDEKEWYVLGRCGYLFEIEGDVYEVILPTWISKKELYRALDETALEKVFWCWEREKDGKYTVEMGRRVFETELPEGLSDKDAEELLKKEVLKRTDRRVL